MQGSALRPRWGAMDRYCLLPGLVVGLLGACAPTAAPHTPARMPATEAPVMEGPVTPETAKGEQPAPKAPLEEAVASEDGERERDDTPSAQPAAQPKPATPAPNVRAPRAKLKRDSRSSIDDLLLNPMKSAGTPGLGVQGYGRGADGLGVASAGIVGPADFNTEAYAHIPDNDVQRALDRPLSTFSIDVDTASYSNVRRFLRDGMRPPIDAVRIEELINYFDYGYAPPEGDVPFALHTEVASAPWNPERRLVRIALKGRQISADKVPARNLVFLLDVSGSMQSPDKLPLLKRAMTLLTRELREQDRVAIVVYAGASGLVLPSTAGSAKGRILGAIGALEAGGATNGADGIELAYHVARHNFIRDGINRVILATDGDFNVGISSHGELTRLIEQERHSGVFLTVLGFGTGNLKDATMETLADKGNGNYAYIDSIDEAHKVLVREAGSTLVTIAKDVKIQVEWNPRKVASYRLIGYENRTLADRDFNDDTKDAGEIGAGHSVTALYEVALAGRAPRGGELDPLRYQAERDLTPAAASNELLTVKVRYKRPRSDKSELLERAVVDRGRRFDASSADFRWSSAVAAFGMLLRDSAHKGAADIALVQRLARSVLRERGDDERREFLELTDQAAPLGGVPPPGLQP